MPVEFQSDMHVWQSGEPDPDREVILFLHAVGQTGQMWNHHMRALGEEGNYYCLAPDLPGHGRSNRLPWTTMDDISHRVAGLVKDHAGRTKIHIVGLSLGGSLAICLLKNYPELADSVVIDGAGAGPIRFHRLMIAGVSLISPFIHTKPVIALIASALGIDAQSRPRLEQSMRTASPQGFRRGFAQANRLTIPDGLDRVSGRVLFMAGEKEPARVQEAQRAMAGAIRQARVYAVPGLGHGGLLATRPQSHVRLVQDWIEHKELAGATAGQAQDNQVEPLFV